MNRMILYGSEYGTAQRYAEKMSQLTGIPVFSYSTAQDFAGCKLVVYFGGLYAGGVKGLKQTIKHLPTDIKLILATVGLADVTDEENLCNIRRSVRKQLPEHLWENTTLFHLIGGIDYSRLSFTHKTMMTLVYNKAKRLPEEKKTAEVRAMIETFNTKVDFVDLDALSPIVEAAQHAQQI